MGDGIPAFRLHHHAYVVDDQEATRAFYEDLLGFPLVATWCEVETVRGKERTYCHTFFELKDGSALAFFQFLDSDDQAEMKLDSRNSLNHVALSSTLVDQERLRSALDAAGVEHRPLRVQSAAPVGYLCAGSESKFSFSLYSSLPPPSTQDHGTSFPSVVPPLTTRQPRRRRP